MENSPAAAPEGTRLALIDAGLKLFGEKGFAATSTRQIAALAETNVASIAYHFGGKDGLRLACATDFARRVAAAVAADLGTRVSSPEQARTELRALLRRMVLFMIGQSNSEELVSFMLREMTVGGKSLDTIYSRLLGPTHWRICSLLATATGADAESEPLRITAFGLIGQIVYFRLAAPVVTRRMGWESLGPIETNRIADTFLRNLDALLEAKKN